MAEQGGIAAIFWGPHSLSTEHYAQHLKARFYAIHYLQWKRPLLAPVKYPLMWLKTWALMLKQRPSSIFVINTPVFAPLCIYTYCLVARIPYVMNIHGHSFTGRRWGWSLPLQRFLARKALINLVDFTDYKRLFESWGAKVMILEDPPLDIHIQNPEQTTNTDQFNVTVISTFAGDEPLDLVVEAVRQLPGVHCYILGDTTLADPKLLGNAPENVVFPGYLKGDTYWNQLNSSQAIMTLTSNPDSLVAGGIEGMNLGKPLILSRQPVLVDYFTKGAVFVDHSTDSIAEGIRQAQKGKQTLGQQSAELAVEKRERWGRTFQELMKLLGEG
jgi:glycosyltransferase involved in cell wall biosynthesis